MDHAWSKIIVLWLIGILAAAQLSKFAILAPELRSTFDLSLAGMGLLISLLEIGGALFGFVAGIALGRFGNRTFLTTGLVTLALTGVVEAVAPNTLTLFAARTVEGIGYVLVVIAAPTVIAALASDRDRPAALALWSTFVAVGVAVGGIVTSVALELMGITATLLLWPGASILGLVAVARVPMAGASRGSKAELPQLGAWLATLGFGFYTMFICALTALLPTFLMERSGVGIGIASMTTAMVSLAALPGSAIAIYITRRIVLESGSVARLITPTLLVAAMVTPIIFPLATGAGPVLIGATLLAMLAVLLSGIASPILFGRLPHLAGARNPSDQRIAAANGLLTQFGAGGALIGPPLGGLVVERWGWNSLGFTIAGLVLAMLVLILCAEALANQRSLTAPSEA